MKPPWKRRQAKVDEQQDRLYTLHQEAIKLVKEGVLNPGWNYLGYVVVYIPEDV